MHVCVEGCVCARPTNESEWMWRDQSEALD